LSPIPLELAVNKSQITPVGNARLGFRDFGELARRAADDKDLALQEV
jgi:hypothetical protein